jgi:hypothetical protein
MPARSPNVEVFVKGYIFVSPGSDPGAGKILTDPILGPRPTMGACRPDLRKHVQSGDRIFVVSGSTRGFSQYIIAGFEIDQKLDALTAYAQFPEHRLRLGETGQKEGNIIVTPDGQHNPLDEHDQFDKRIQNYLVGRNPVALEKSKEIELGRERSLELLREIFNRPGARTVQGVIGRARKLDERQIEKLLDGLNAIKAEAARARAR